MEVAFWLLVSGVLYSYLLYPLTLSLLPKRRHAHDETGTVPSLSIIIAAHNEGGRIEAKLNDILAQDYPPDQIEVFVVSDASEDNTDQIVMGFAERGVRLLRKTSREGKESSQAAGLAASKGDVLVFSDVAARMVPGSLRRIAAVLSRPAIGALSSEDQFDSSDVSGEGLYVRYEMMLRSLESRRGGLVGLSGSFFAARREVCEPWPTHVPSDFSVALNCARHGYRAISDAGVVGVYPNLRSAPDEFARKRRTVLRGMSALAHYPEALSLQQVGVFAFQVWSHKIMRWAVPWFLLMLAIVTMPLLATGGIFLLAGILQALLYGSFLLGSFVPASRRITLIRIAYYFVQVNLATAFALVDFLRGRRVVTWNPSKR